MATENKPSRLQSWLSSLKTLSARDIVQGIENIFGRIGKFIDYARKTFYRLVVLNNETFEEVGSYKLSLMNLYVLVSSLLVGFTVLVVALIIFTPLKRLIPGYGGIGTQRDAYELMLRVDSLERSLSAQEVYTQNFRRMITDDVQREGDMPKNTAISKDSLYNTEPTDAEMTIRAGGGPDFDPQEAKTTEGGKALFVSGANDRLERMYLIAPVSGSISADFSLTKKHYGIDIIAPKNTPVKACADGFVITSDWTLETGNTIAIQHANNVVSFYKHNTSLLKKVGDRVKTGEAIAIIGNTGEQTSGPHLHFELWQNGKPVNPSEYIRF
jgi:murein DD-endopeptidase MepM/ murein hydrolase activator NlpD